MHERITPFLPVKSIIRSIVPLSADNYLFNVSINEPERIKDCLPGQFVQLWIPGVGECPISICSRYLPGNIELCVRKIGRVTSALFDMQEGDWIGLRGPYGDGFPLVSLEGKNLVLVAGGLGVAPIRALWQYIIDNREKFGKIVLIYGMRHSIELLFRAEFKVLLQRHDIDVYIAAEDIVGPQLPPLSFQLGRVTDMIKLASLDKSFCATICGPPIMYKYVLNELRQKGVAGSNTWLLLERHMKCAIGKCGHCFVGGQLTCRNGPVFALSDLRFIPEVIECS